MSTIDDAFDLREWLGRIDDLGELATLPGVAADLEIGAVTDLNARQRGPALLFTEIAGYDEGRVLSCSVASAKRLATALGLDPALDDQGLIEALQGLPGAWEDAGDRFAPTVVDRGPVLERVVEEADLDMTRYPAPRWHELDGGNYLGTGCCVITNDPETGSINVGTYRIPVHDEKTLGLWIEPIHHGAINIQKYHERGEPAPVAVSFGHHPMLHLASSMPMAYGHSELDYAGAMRSAPLEVIEGEVTGLPFPANAELVVEGWIHPGDLAEEGPFGEFTGYYAGGRSARPVIRVKRVYQQSNPIVYGSLPSRPPFDHSYWRAVVQSSKLLDRLRSSGVPDVRSVWKFEAGCASFFTVISIKQRYAGHVQQVAHLAAMVPESAAMGRYFVVVDEDVNPMDIEEVIWVMSTRTDPATSIQFIEGAATNPLDPMLASHDHPWVASRAVIDACRPFDRRDSFAPVVSVGPELAARVQARFAQTLGWSR